MYPTLMKLLFELVVLTVLWAVGYLLEDRWGANIRWYAPATYFVLHTVAWISRQARQPKYPRLQVEPRLDRHGNFVPGHEARIWGRQGWE